MNEQPQTNNARLERAMSILRAGVSGRVPASEAVIEARPVPVAVAQAPHRADALPDRAFILSGRSRFRLRSCRTGQTFEYKVTAADRGGWFVNLQDGEVDGWAGCRYMGFIGQNRVFRLTARSNYDAAHAGVLAFAYAWGHIAADQPLTGKVEVVRH